MCEMRGDLFVWCPEDQLIYTTNLKCLHSNTKQYRKIYQVIVVPLNHIILVERQTLFHIIFCSTKITEIFL